MEKNRIATSSKSEELKSRTVKEAGDAINACLELLASTGNISTPDIKELSADRVLKHTTDELSSSPVLCMELRTFIAHQFLMVKPSDTAQDATSQDKLLKCLDLDPFFCGQSDMKKLDSVKHLDEVIEARERWMQDVKTVRGPGTGGV